MNSVCDDAQQQKVFSIAYADSVEYPSLTFHSVHSDPELVTSYICRIDYDLVRAVVIASNTREATDKFWGMYNGAMECGLLRKEEEDAKENRED